MKGLVLDVGAHHGIYAMEVLRRYPECHVIAVEPDAAACRSIRLNAALNGVSSRIEIVEAGLAERNGQGWLEWSARGSWGHRTRSADSRADGGAGAPVELRTLDATLAGRRPALVKCNAEGAEFAVIPRLVALGLKPRVIVLMLHPESGDIGSLLSLLIEAGYDVLDADRPPKGCRFHCVLAARREP